MISLLFATVASPALGVACTLTAAWVASVEFRVALRMVGAAGGGGSGSTTELEGGLGPSQLVAVAVTS